MFTRQTIKTTFHFFLLALFCIIMTGCATSKSEDVPAANPSYAQPNRLPTDYPTKQLPDGDMWKEFRDDLQLPVDPNNPLVKAQIRWYQKNQGFLNRSIVRGAPYLFYIYQQTKKNHLPAELALIPIGESGFNPLNRSNKGAVGLWQFMPGTAATYGLRMNKYYDGRKDLITSTDAALKYFTYLYYYFDNNWLLAIAAYDTGEGNVQKAILRNQRTGASTNFWSLNLHRETREYIPKLLALSAIIKNPNKYGIHLVAINNAPYCEQVSDGQQITLKQAAKFANYNPEIIRNLNSQYLRVVTEPNGPHFLLIPKAKVSLFKKKLTSGDEEEINENTANNLAYAEKATSGVNSKERNVNLKE